MQMSNDCVHTIPRDGRVLAGLIFWGACWGVAGLGFCGWGVDWALAGLGLRGWLVGGVLSKSPSKLGEGILSKRRHSAHWAKWVSTTSCSMLPGRIELARINFRM